MLIYQTALSNDENITFDEQQVVNHISWRRKGYMEFVQNKFDGLFYVSTVLRDFVHLSLLYPEMIGAYPRHHVIYVIYDICGCLMR